MHFAFEKGGLVLDNQPIPWNADAVVVECLARLPGPAVRRREDFHLRIPGSDPVPLDNLRREETDDRYRLFFRLSPPGHTTNAEVIWRRTRLGELTLPAIGREEFLAKLTLQLPTLAVQLGGQTVACQAFVGGQCKGLTASALLASPTSLAPLLDLDFHVEYRPESAPRGESGVVHLSSSQLRGKQALVSVTPPALVRRAGAHVLSWMVEGRCLATQRIKSLSKTMWLRSLRISDSRFVVEAPGGKVSLARQVPPWDEVAGVGPCFLISSSEVGVAATCNLGVRVQVGGGLQAPTIAEKSLLITDGPTPFVPGTLPTADLKHAAGFELCVGMRSLGCLALTAMPVARFDSEGGFQAPPAFLWSPAAEDQLQEKLAQLLTPQK
jgi:hypothetical protein